AQGCSRAVGQHRDHRVDHRVRARRPAAFDAGAAGGCVDQLCAGARAGAADRLEGAGQRAERASRRERVIARRSCPARPDRESVMPKRIVVCSDGTGNTAIKGRGTNVFKLFEAVDLESHRYDSSATPQIAIYDDGVGTEQFKPLKVLSGATGWGLSRNVKHLYKELARGYDPGDDVYVFGVSRGAFTVRTLVGFIQTCGLVDPDRLESKTFATLNRAVNEGYKAYRRCYRPTLWRRFFATTRDAGERFKREHSRPGPTPIRFVGVWDTVDAVGLPLRISDLINATLYQFKFSDRTLSPLV